MGYNGNLNSRASEVITTEGDLRRGDSSGNPERLAIGSANQLLQSNGTTESWATVAGSPTTTKGDLSGFSTASARIPVGTNNHTILADSAEALGLKYGASATSVLATTGDILCASSANVLSGVGAGASGTVMTGNGVGVMPSFQSSSASPSFNLQSEQMGTAFTTSSTSFVDVTDMTITLTQTTGRFLGTWIGSVYANASGHLAKTRLTLDGTMMQHEIRYGTEPANVYKPIVVQFWGVSSVVDVVFQLAMSNPSYTASILGNEDSLNTMEIY